MRHFIILTKISLTLAIISWTCKPQRAIKYWDNGNIKSIKKLNHEGKRLDGLSKFYYPNGKLESVMRFKSDTPYGFAKIWYETGELMYKNKIIGYEILIDTIDQQFILQNLCLNYKVCRYYRNGKIELKGYEYCGRKNGEWIFFDNQGKVYKREYFINDSIIYSR